MKGKGDISVTYVLLAIDLKCAEFLGALFYQHKEWQHCVRVIFFIDGALQYLEPRSHLNIFKWWDQE